MAGRLADALGRRDEVDAIDRIGDVPKVEEYGMRLSDDAGNHVCQEAIDARPEAAGSAR